MRYVDFREELNKIMGFEVTGLFIGNDFDLKSKGINNMSAAKFMKINNSIMVNEMVLDDGSVQHAKINELLEKIETEEGLKGAKYEKFQNSASR